jgi:undecaprenyl diphosphate synthase
VVSNPFPKHIAIIMDGNGRWAKKQGFVDRIKGHNKGAEVVREITTHCGNIGIEYLTLYAFSTENWKRPKAEVDHLMKMLDSYLKNELDTYMKNGIRFKAIGNIDGLSPKLIDRIKNTEHLTSTNSKLTQVLALNYGSRDEILRASKHLADSGEEFTEENFEKYLDTKDIPDVDMMIRTSGEQRISNYLLWQCAYAEFFFTETLWPDFTGKELDELIEDFQNRDRRFGGI